MTKQRKWVLLGGLVLLWVILVFMQFSDESQQIGAPGRPVVPAPQLVQASSSAASPSLTLAEVNEPARQNVAFSNPRNIFAPLSFKKPAPPPSKAKAVPVITKPKKLAQKKPPPPSGPSPGELAARRARQQLNKYQFLGYLQKGGESQAFLSNGQDIYIVRQGEIMEGRIHISKIDPSNIVLSTEVQETGAQIEATIPLTKEKKG